MPNDVRVPGLGQTPKGAVIAGVLAVAGVGGYLLYQHYIKPKTAATTAGYGQYGYGNAAYPYGQVPYGYSAFGYGYVPSSYGGYPGGGGFYPGVYGYGAGSGGGTQQGPPTTNAQWGQLVEANLGSNGTDAIGAAVAKYLLGMPLTQAQSMIIAEAEATAGPPPVAGIGGYPPKMHVSGQHPGQNGHGGKPPPPKTTTITIHRAGTLSQIARQRGWSTEFLQDVEQMTGLSAGAHLRRGEKLTIPAGSVKG